MSKENERRELFKALWKIANEERGGSGSTPWDLKQYIFGTLFYRFISENLIHYINLQFELNYTDISDEDAEIQKQAIVEEKGFFIYPTQLFCNVIKKINNQNFKDKLNEEIPKIFNSIEQTCIGTKSENDFAGLWSEFDFNNIKLGQTIMARNSEIAKLFSSVNNLPLGNFQNNTIDLFGDAYEYLMNMYAGSIGKTGGDFFTPQEVAELLAKITLVDKNSVNKVYDPCCGSGGLLLKFAKIIGVENVKKGFYGQEKDLTVYNLCRMNMFLHNINYEKFNIVHDNTLLKPSQSHKDEQPFEVIVSNPPYSVHWDGDSDPILINDERFSAAGVLAPKSKADLAFVMHCLSWLSTNGTAAIVEFPGVLYRGGAEQKIRKYLVDNNFIECIIQLPSNLFFGTSISTCIIILKKSKKEAKTLFIDASNEFRSETNSNKLTTENIERILKWYKNKENVEHICTYVDNAKIEENDYNLSVNTYVSKQDIRETIDIDELNKEIDLTVKKITMLRNDINEIIKTEIKPELKN
ncbi:MAG: type I restriction-modification system subunit M [Mycoplasmataceae bacterium]|nr:type I restriction-modification system subunit M [Mycoplasmataceae bacterium]